MKEDHLCCHPMQLYDVFEEDGYVHLPTGPGWGVDIVEDAEELYPPQNLAAIEGNARYYPE